MKPSELQNIVTEAVALDRRIQELTRSLKALKGALIEEACRPEREAERTATDGGGWSWTAPGADGCIARVTAPAPKLRAAFDPTVTKTAKLLARFGSLKRITKFFSKETVFRPREDFRALVEQDFAPATAAKLIAACESESTPRVEFETADREAEVTHG